MICKTHLLLFLALSSIPIFITAHSSSKCHQTCGHNNTAKRHFFPFIGTSSDCLIRLNCSKDGDLTVGDEFPVQNIGAETLLIKLEKGCNRSIKSMDHLFNSNYAPTTRNGFLLRHCKSAASKCPIPTTKVNTHFDSTDCGPDNSSIACYAEESENGFLSFANVSARNCLYLFSSILVDTINESSVVLDVGIVQLGWWLLGECNCHREAKCTNIQPVSGEKGFRCQCREGFHGDGYQAGEGCRKASSGCNPSRYISGQCGGPIRFFVLAGGIALTISISIICCFIRRSSKLRATNSTKRRLSEATGKCSIPIYPYKEIEKSTNCFSEKQRLGTGAYGTVYSGKLHNQWVAIKRIKHRDTDSIEEVLNEIKLISSVSHPNLVRLLGCSIEKGEQILVYEFMANGTLSQHLRAERGNGLVWSVRLSIAAQTAQAIAHLHSALDPPIYHRDIKSSNILLDRNFIPKLADFGLSRLGMAETESSHISTAPQGTPGYLDPQYHQNFHLSDKSDVYSFGVVLVEMITALKVVDFSRPQNEVNLAALAIDRIGKGRLDEIIDPFLEGDRDDWSLLSLQKVAELAFRCLAFHKDMRPSMMEVAAELEQIKVCKWGMSTSEENMRRDSWETSSCCCSSNVSEIPLTSMNSMGILKDNSPVSVQDPWLSGQSSPSSNSLLNNVIKQQQHP